MIKTAGIAHVILYQCSHLTRQIALCNVCLDPTTFPSASSGSPRTSGGITIIDRFDHEVHEDGERSVKRWSIPLVAILICTLWLSTRPDTPPKRDDQQRDEQPHTQQLSFGVVPQFGIKHLAEVWEPLIRQLELASGLQIQVSPSRSIPEFEASFSRGEYDFAYMNPYHYLRAKRDQGYKPLLRDQTKQLKGILVAAVDSEINSVQDLDGKPIAFPAPNALGASLYMRALLERTHDIHFEPIYVNSHDSVYLNIVANEVLAGGGVRRTLVTQPQEIQDQLKIIYETPGVSPHPIVCHPRVPDDQVKKFINAWQFLSESEVGRSLLAEIPMIEPGEAVDEDYRPLEDLNLDDFYVAPQSNGDGS